jgi:lipoprotein signal peptidase
LLRAGSLTSCRVLETAPHRTIATFRLTFPMTSSSPQPVTISQRASAFLRRNRVLLVLLAADAASKIAAFLMLPNAETVEVAPGIKFFLAVNDWGVMGGVHGIGAVTANPSYTLFLAFGLLVFAAVIYRLGQSSLTFGWRVVMGTAVFLFVAFAAQAFAKPLSHITMPSDVVVMTIRLAALMVAIAFYAVARSPMPRAIFTMFAAGALSNALSYTYPPFEVVDFLMVPIQPFLSMLGPGVSAETTVGVINFADLYLFTVPFLVALWMPAALFLRWRARPVG